MFLKIIQKNKEKILLNECKDSNEDNIINCYDLRAIFVKYNELVTKLYNNENKNENIIKKESNNFYYKDVFAYLLDGNIKKFISDNESSEIINPIINYDIFYIDEK